MPDLIDKRTGHPTAIDFHINNKYNFSITTSHAKVKFEIQIHKEKKNLVQAVLRLRTR